MSLGNGSSAAGERNLISCDQDEKNDRSVIDSVRPEVFAGGIVRDDGEIEFFVRVNALLQPEMTVLDYGAGRGVVFVSDKVQFREKLAKLQGKVKKVIGVDVDDGILQHPFLDERHVINVDSKIPVEDQSIDIIVAHWVFEHIEHPSQMMAEFSRVLKPGGWIVARTPHRWSYVGLATCLIPHRIQQALLRLIRPGLNPEDKFPTVYKLNSMRALRMSFPSSQWVDCSYGMNSVPRYHFENRWIFKILSAYQSIAWPKTDILVLVQKRLSPQG